MEAYSIHSQPTSLGSFIQGKRGEKHKGMECMEGKE